MATTRFRHHEELSAAVGGGGRIPTSFTQTPRKSVTGKIPIQMWSLISSIENGRKGLLWRPFFSIKKTGD